MRNNKVKWIVAAALIAVTAIAFGRPIKDKLGEVIDFYIGGVKQAEIATSGSRLQIDNLTDLAGTGAVNFPFGANGISAAVQDFNISAVTDPNATIKGGFILLNDGRELATYDTITRGADFTANLDTILGTSPAATTVYYLYIDLSKLGSEVDVNGRKLYDVTETELSLSTTNPANINGSRFVVLGKVESDGGSNWSSSNVVSIATKTRQTELLAVSPKIYTLPRQSIGTVGSVDNTQGALTNSDTSSGACYELNVGSSGTCSAPAALAETGGVSFSEKGFFNRGQVASLDGVDDYLSVVDGFFDPGVSFTMGGWFKIKSRGATTGLLEVSSNTSTDTGPKFLMSSGNVISCRVTSVTGTHDASDNLINLDDYGSGWIHLVMSHSGTNKKCYINGAKLVDVTTLGQRSTTVDDFHVGMSPVAGTPSEFMEGEAQDVFFSQVDLTEAEVNAIYSKRFRGQQIAGGHELNNDSFARDDLTGNTFYYNLNTTADDSGNAATLVADEGAVTFDGLDIFGGATTANFDGASSLSFPAAATPWSTVEESFFMGGWGQINDTSVTNMIFGASGGYTIELSLATGNVRCNTTDTGSFFDGLASVTDGQWHYWSIQYDILTHRWACSIDGVELASIISDPTFGAVTAFSLGRRSSSAERFWNGSIDEVVIIRGRVPDDEEIRKLMSSRIDHNSNSLSDDQDWLSQYSREDGDITNTLDNGYLLDKKRNSLYVDFGLNSGDEIELQLQNTGIGASVIPIRTFDTGLISGAPTFPLAHGLVEAPDSLILKHEGHTTLGKIDNLDVADYCSYDATVIDCDLSGLTIDSTHRIEIIASNAPLAVALEKAFDGLFTVNKTRASKIVDVGETLFHPNLEIDTGHVIENNGELLIAGVITGPGVLIGSGTVRSLDMGQNGDTAFFSGDVVIAGDLTGTSPINMPDGATVADLTVSGNAILPSINGEVPFTIVDSGVGGTFSAQPQSGSCLTTAGAADFKWTKFSDGTMRTFGSLLLDHGGYNAGCDWEVAIVMPEAYSGYFQPVCSAGQQNGSSGDVSVGCGCFVAARSSVGHVGRPEEDNVELDIRDCATVSGSGNNQKTRIQFISWGTY